ncbi:hypothetical protein CVT24_006340 [Panaeolus cyanescens]|uniref:DUF6534 domain-containing protein n=1 Tax=Panaeolus cyanescens TaxID=181874 RepID=A0A409YEB2_9AGAR|nr:hypothetical protein CVT24_006340 [Panaeolus cyanescens]
MAPVLTSTYGVWLVSLFLETILYGCGLLQAWLYFHWYHDDRILIRGMVLLLVVLETLQIVFIFASTYSCLIIHFGDFAYLQEINWADEAQFPTYISTFIVQIHSYWYADLLRLPYGTDIPACLSLFVIIDLVQEVKLVKLNLWSTLSTTSSTYVLQSAATLACDLLITGSLLFRLNSSRTGLRSTNSLLDKLMINAINRGGLTAFAAAWNLILFIAIPNTFWFVIGYFISSKLYMNSALASLNSRQHIRNQFTNVTPSEPLEFNVSQMRTMDTFRAETNINAGSDVNMHSISATFDRRMFEVSLTGVTVSRPNEVHLVVGLITGNLIAEDEKKTKLR